MRKHYDLLFYATENDLRYVLSEAEVVRKLVYVEDKHYEKLPVRVYQTQLEIDWLGTTESRNPLFGKRLILQDSNYAVRFEEVNFGGQKVFTPHPNVNKESITLWPGGKLDDEVLISGSFGTAHRNGPTLNLFRRLTRIVESRFVRNGEFWLGEEATNLLQNGCWLTTNADLPRSYALSPRLVL